jgi:hypothetical protein
MYFRNIICILSIFLMCYSFVSGQMAGKVLSNFEQLSMPAADWQNTYNQSFRTRLPWVERIEFRSETDRLMLSREEFLTRATFNGRAQRNAESNKLTKYATWKAEERDVFWHPALKNAYMDLVSWHHHVLDLKTLKEREILLNKEVSSYNKLLQEGIETNLSDYLTLQLEKKTLLFELENARTQWVESARILGADTVEAVFDAFWIGPEQMNAVLDSLQMEEIRQTGSEMAYLDASAELIRSESRRIVDFVQVKYTVRDDLLLQNRFTVGVGLIIPWRGSANVKIQEISARREQLREKERAQKVQQSMEYRQLRKQFNAIYVSWKQWQEIENDSSLRALKNKFMTSGRVDIEKLYDFDKEMLKRKELQQRDLRKMSECYIELLHTSGALYKKPLINYLYGLRTTLSQGNE